MGTFGESRRGRRGAREERAGRGRGWNGVAGGPVRPVFGRRDGGWGEKPDYKTAALCKQVRRVVGLTLSGECGDPLLQSLVVEEVLPAPNAGRLLVRVLLRVEPGGPGLVEVLQRLAGVQGLVRSRVGEAIARKRTPELVFDVVPVGAAPAVGVEGGCGHVE